MKYLFLLLMLTGCGQKTDNAKPEAAAENITNIALAKYEAREELTEEEYLSLRKPVPDWETYNRLTRVEDGFDNLPVFYIQTNTVAPNLEWCGIIYYDPKKESYYHGAFKPTNINGWQDLINTKKDPAQEVYGRDRVVLISNISPSLHIYADAYNKYHLYSLDLKSTVDDYGVLARWDASKNEQIVVFSPLYRMYDYNSNDKVVWRAQTNRSFYSSIKYYALTNGIPVIPEPIIAYYVDNSNILKELSNHDKKTLKIEEDSTPYTKETKAIYYGLKYNFYGELSELTNKNPPLQTNYIKFPIYNGEIIDDAFLGEYLRGTQGAFSQN